MKKAITTIVLVAFAATCFIGCSSSGTTSGSATEAESTSTAEVTTTTTTEATTTTTTAATTTTESTLSRTINADSKKLDELLAKQPVYISKTKYVVQSKRWKSLYPDMLQAIITNKSKDDIKTAYVAFVAWDKNNLPVKIKGDIDFTDGEYVQKVKYNNINLVPGKSYGSSSGLALDTGLGIKKFKAVVAGYDDFDGNTWTNPYFNCWEEMYGGGKKLTADMHVDVYLTSEDYEEMVRKSKEPAIPTKAPTKAPTKKPKKKKKK